MAVPESLPDCRPRAGFLARRGRRAALWRLLCLWHARSRERQHLAELEPRVLHDLGLSDGDVASEVRKPFWRP